MGQDKNTEAYKIIKNSKNILLVTHKRPDGDAIASICAFAEFLHTLAKPFFAYCFNAPPRQYSFLPSFENISSDKKTLDFINFDLIIILDCGSLSRTGLASDILNRNKKQIVIEFDHHPRVDTYADYEFKDTNLSSTNEVLYHFFEANNIAITKNMATCLLTGITTDTANFLFPITSERTMSISSKLLLKGARFPTILSGTSRNKSLESMKLWGKAMSNIKINHKYNFAFTYLTYLDLKDSKDIQEELEGMPEFLSNIYGVKAMLLLREEKKGSLKGSLRTSSTDKQVDISLIAQFLGGGGHAKTSGFSLEGNLRQSENGLKITD